MHKGSLISLGQAGRNTLERLWIAASGWNDVRTRRGRRHADRRAGVLLSSADLRTRLGWDAALDALGIHRSALLSVEEVIKWPEVVADELDLIVIADKHPNTINEIANRLAIPIINAGNPLGEPAKVVAESLHVIKRTGTINNATLLYIGADSPILRSWIEVMQICSGKLIQLAPLHTGVNRDYLSSINLNAQVEVVEAAHSDQDIALRELSRYADIVRLADPRQSLLIERQAIWFEGQSSAAQRILAPVAAAMVETAL